MIQLKKTTRHLSLPSFETNDLMLELDSFPVFTRVNSPAEAPALHRVSLIPDSSIATEVSPTIMIYVTKSSCFSCFLPILSGGEDQALPLAEGETGVYNAHGPGVPAVLRHRGPV